LTTILTSDSFSLAYPYKAESNIQDILIDQGAQRPHSFFPFQEWENKI
jgi:hypothetical protein